MIKFLPDTLFYVRRNLTSPLVLVGPQHLFRPGRGLPVRREPLQEARMDLRLRRPGRCRHRRGRLCLRSEHCRQRSRNELQRCSGLGQHVTRRRCFWLCLSVRLRLRSGIHVCPRCSGLPHLLRRGTRHLGCWQDMLEEDKDCLCHHVCLNGLILAGKWCDETLGLVGPPVLYEIRWLCARRWSVLVHNDFLLHLWCTYIQACCRRDANESKCSLTMSWQVT